MSGGTETEDFLGEEAGGLGTVVGVDFNPDRLASCLFRGPERGAGPGEGVDDRLAWDAVDNPAHDRDRLRTRVVRFLLTTDDGALRVALRLVQGHIRGRVDHRRYPVAEADRAS